MEPFKKVFGFFLGAKKGEMEGGRVAKLTIPMFFTFQVVDYLMASVVVMNSPWNKIEIKFLWLE